MGEMPKGWAASPLSDLLQSLESGGRPKGGVKGISKGVPSIGGEHLTYNGCFDFSSIRYVPVEFAKRMTKGRINKNDILIVKDGATTGKTAFVGYDFPFDEAVVNEHVFICRLCEGIEPRFVFRFLTSKEGQENILNNFQGSAQGGINLSFAPNTTVPFAPLHEQRRIVAKLEKLLHRVDACKERLDKIPSILKRFRQSVLSAACSGRLTADWREEKELPEDWSSLELGELCDGFQYGTSTKSLLSGKVPVLRMGNIQNGQIDWTDLVYTSNAEEIEKYQLKPGDVLFNRTNSPELVGKTGIYRGERPAIYAGYLIRIKNKPLLHSEYLNYCLNTIDAKEWCRQVRTDGVSQSNINATKLATFSIPLPPLPEQQEIVRRVEALFKKADAIEERYKKAKVFVDKLTQSILAKAFRGELVAQDPNDEPASVLLERIRAEKEKTQKKVVSIKDRAKKKYKPYVPTDLPMAAEETAAYGKRQRKKRKDAH